MFLYLACLCLSVNAVAGFCCYPDQMEFYEGILEGTSSATGHTSITTGRIQISYDATNKRIYTNNDLEVGTEKVQYQTLQLYQQNVKYTIQNGICTRSAQSLASWTPSCIPANATLAKEYTVGGNQSIKISEYHYSMNMDTVVGITDNCVPVLANVRGEINGYHFLTFSGFQELTTGIKDPHVFDIPKICQQADMDMDGTDRSRSAITQLWK